MLQVCCPNGMDWDQDKGLFYFIDTADSVVRSYPIDENGVPKRSQDGVLLGVKDVSTLSTSNHHRSAAFSALSEEITLMHGTLAFALCPDCDQVHAQQQSATWLLLRRPTTGNLYMHIRSGHKAGHRAYRWLSQHVMTTWLLHLCTAAEHIPINKFPLLVQVIVAEEGIVFDGMTIDSKGNLWIAHGEGSAVVCYNPTSGKEIERVNLPVKRPTSCTFGGQDLKTLYITTRHEGRHLDKGEEASENWGGLFSIQIDGVQGARAALHVEVNNKK